MPMEVTSHPTALTSHCDVRELPLVLMRSSRLELHSKRRLSFIFDYSGSRASTPDSLWMHLMDSSSCNTFILVFHLFSLHLYASLHAKTSAKYTLTIYHYLCGEETTLSTESLTATSSIYHGTEFVTSHALSNECTVIKQQQIPDDSYGQQRETARSNGRRISGKDVLH